MNDRTLKTVNDAIQIVGGVLAVYLTVRLLMGPDAFKTAQMAAVRSAARLAKSQGERLTALGSRLDTTYWKIAQP